MGSACTKLHLQSQSDPIHVTPVQVKAANPKFILTSVQQSRSHATIKTARTLTVNPRKLSISNRSHVSEMNGDVEFKSQLRVERTPLNRPSIAHIEPDSFKGTSHLPNQSLTEFNPVEIPFSITKLALSSESDSFANAESSTVSANSARTVGGGGKTNPTVLTILRSSANGNIRQQRLSISQRNSVPSVLSGGTGALTPLSDDGSNCSSTETTYRSQSGAVNRHESQNRPPSLGQNVSNDYHVPLQLPTSVATFKPALKSGRHSVSKRALMTGLDLTQSVFSSLCGLTKKQANEVQCMGTLQSYTAGTTIFAQHERADQFIIVVKGRVALTYAAPANRTRISLDLASNRFPPSPASSTTLSQSEFMSRATPSIYSTYSPKITPKATPKATPKITPLMNPSSSTSSFPQERHSRSKSIWNKMRSAFKKTRSSLSQESVLASKTITMKSTGQWIGVEALYNSCEFDSENKFNHSCSAIAMTDVTILLLNQESLEDLFVDNDELKELLYQKLYVQPLRIISNFPIFEQIPAEGRLLLNILSPRTFERGDTLFTEGAKILPTSCLYILSNGQFQYQPLFADDKGAHTINPGTMIEDANIFFHLHHVRTCMVIEDSAAFILRMQTVRALCCVFPTLRSWILDKIDDIHISLSQLLRVEMFNTSFFQFCEREHSIENMLFVRAAQRFRFGQSAHLFDSISEEAHRIYNTYISGRAEYQVNVNSKIHDKLRETLTHGEGIPRDIFLQAEETIIRLMSNDTWGRFKESQQLADALFKLNTIPDSFLFQHIKMMEKMQKKTQVQNTPPHRDRASQRTRSTVYHNDDFIKAQVDRSRRRHSTAAAYPGQTFTSMFDNHTPLNIEEVQELFHIRVTCSPVKVNPHARGLSIKDAPKKLARRSMLPGSVRVARLRIEESLNGENYANKMKGSASR